MDILGVNRTARFCADGPHAASGFCTFREVERLKS